ncbi:MAG: ThiF family adenylyltransferase, partial [Candidatus Pacearchaeota archaeon]|nr:ThiF family adenylyltransferase [Candidatus Pacearchaeota archaeon]
MKKKEDIYSFILTGSREVLTFQVDSLVKDTINSLTNGEKKYDDLLRELSKKYDDRNIFQCINSLENKKILRIFKKHDSEIKFKRQIEFLDEFTSSYSETLQLHNKIKNSKINVFGVGGIGSWIVNGLAQIGVNNITICDPDKVEISNLNRQLFFTEKDIGKYKVDVIKKRVPDIYIKTHKKFVSESENLEDIVQDSDFIVNCADSPSVQKTSE